MAIVIPQKSKRPPAPQPTDATDSLNGTSRALADLVRDHANYQFEGFRWLRGTFGGIAEHLGVNEKTVRRAADKPPFHYITRRTAEEGKHILLKLGTELCETDHVFRLRAVWRNGLAFYNVVAVKAWSAKIAQLQHQKAPKALWERLQHRVKAAEEGAAPAEMIKAGGRISYEVKPHQMGCLRGIVRVLSNDAIAVVACLTTFEGWHRFAAYAKITDRITDRHYHWPELGVIAANPDIALQTYLDMAQESAKMGLSESARLLAKVASLTPALAA